MAFQYKNVYWLWLSAAVMLLDQVTKQLVVRHIGYTDVLPVMPYFNLTHMHNTGAAFSMLSGAPRVFFIGLGVAVSIGILWWMRQNPRGQSVFAAALGLILGGALGNVIDRATRGFVVDFLDFYWGSWHFAAFNVADIAISIGAGLVLLDMVLESRRAKQAAAAGG
ncbi:MAG: signal peptidase II [Gammaproteobacteria bacterium]